MYESLDAIVSSPLAPRTPATAGRVVPSKAEMHPSKAQHSTTQKPDPGLLLGFTDINGKGNNQPSGITQTTPSKIAVSSPAFDFRFARPGPQLGPEAQRMMDDLREEALRIKVKLAAEREEEKRKSEERSANGIGGRKIAQPKGKAGRFSDVHMAEFKKMDSIAGHPSAFRAQPGRFPPPTNNLKRTQSKAKLGDSDDDQAHEDQSQETRLYGQSERLENTSPAKRLRQRLDDDTSSTRPVSRDGHIIKLPPSTPSATRTKMSLPASVTTPTQASSARAAAVKHTDTHIPSLSKSPSKPNLSGTSATSIPSLTKSPSRPNLQTPRGIAKSATINNISSLPRSGSNVTIRSPSKFERVKSILGHPSFSSKKSAAPSSIPTLVRSPSRPNLEKTLPSIPTTPTHSKTAKHVEFTPNATNKSGSVVQPSPSPVKSGIPRSISRPNLKATAYSTASHAKSQPAAREVTYPSVGPSNQPKDVEYPSLAGVRLLPEPQQITRPPPSVPGTFTFRSDHTIDFGTSPKGFGASPGQSSVRAVRKSIFPNAMPGSFPDSNKENFSNLPSVPHGMSNKKRRRVDSDEEEEEAERSPKKYKAQAAEGVMLMAPNLQVEKMTPSSTTSTPKKKGLSLSRLNMLARPKMRR